MCHLHEKKDSSREDVTVRWIVGHKDVEGNEVADREAKLVVRGAANSSPKHKLPIALWKQLPHSIPALKQHHNAMLKKLWKDEWSISTHFPHLSTIDPMLPSRAFMKLTGSLCKRQAGLYTQLRMGHAPLNKHLFHFKCSDSPNCLQCSDSMPELVHHFLFVCPRYNRERFILEQDVGWKVYHVAHLLAHPNARAHLLCFINETTRLKMTFGEVYYTYLTWH